MSRVAIPTTITLLSHIKQHIENNPLMRNRISQWINETYEKHWMQDSEFLQKEIEKREKELEFLKNKINKFENSKDQFIKNLNLSDEEERFLIKEVPRRLEKVNLKGILKFFNNVFSRKFTENEFSIVLNYMGVSI